MQKMLKSFMRRWLEGSSILENMFLEEKIVENIAKYICVVIYLFWFLVQKLATEELVTAQI